MIRLRGDVPCVSPVFCAGTEKRPDTFIVSGREHYFAWMLINSVFSLE